MQRHCRILPENNSLKRLISGQDGWWMISDLKFDDKSIYDVPRVATSLLLEIIVIFVNFRTKKEETKHFGCAILPKNGYACVPP